MLPGCKAHSEGHGDSGSSREGPEVTSIRASPAFPERDPTPTSRTGPGSIWGCPNCKCLCWAEAYVLAISGSPVIFHLMEHLPCTMQHSEQCLKQIVSFFSKWRVYSNYTFYKVICWFWYKNNVFPTNLWEKWMLSEEPSARLSCGLPHPSHRWPYSLKVQILFFWELQVIDRPQKEVSEADGEG